MRSILFISLLLVFVCSCQHEEMSISYDSGVAVSSRISISEVYSMVTKPIEGTKASMSVSVEPVVEGADTVMYIVNYDDGWAVIPADRRLPVNLITSESGNISFEDLVLNEATGYYIASLKEEIYDMVTNPVDVSSVNTKSNGSLPYSFYEDGIWWAFAYKYISNTTVEKVQRPLVQTKWGQGNSTYKWNIRAPYTSSSMSYHCPTGCTNVAVAQLLYYLHNKIGKPMLTYQDCVCSAYCMPSELNSGHVIVPSEISFSNLSNCWSMMPLRAGSSISDAAYGIVSTLMVRLGYLIGSSYAPSGTGTVFTNVPSILSSEFDISSSIGTYNPALLSHQIYDLKMPVLLSMGGTDPATNSEVRHSFIADGYKKVNEVYTYVYKSMDESSTTYKYIDNAQTISSEYITLNWGYDGSGDMSAGSPIWYVMGDTYTNGSITYNKQLYNSRMIYNYN